MKHLLIVSWIRNSVSRLNLDNVSGIKIRNNGDFNNNEFELWIYRDVEKNNGIVVAFAPTHITLYLLQNGITTPTKVLQ